MQNINKIRNDFEQEMINNGYKIFKSSFNNSLRGFQKRFDDKKGKKYFITIWHYNYGEQLNRFDLPQKDSYTSEAQFRFEKSGKDNTCNIEYWGDVIPNKYRPITTLKNIEDFFDNCWKKLKPDYYETF